MIVEVPRWTNAKMEVIKKNALIYFVFMEVATMQWLPVGRVQSQFGLLFAHQNVLCWKISLKWCIRFPCNSKKCSACNYFLSGNRKSRWALFLDNLLTSECSISAAESWSIDF